MMTPEEEREQAANAIVDYFGPDAMPIGMRNRLAALIQLELRKAAQAAVRAEQVSLLSIVQDRNNGRDVMIKFIRDRMYQK